MKRVEPSANVTIAPPGCLLEIALPLWVAFRVMGMRSICRSAGCAQLMVEPSVSTIRIVLDVPSVMSLIAAGLSSMKTVCSLLLHSLNTPR